MPERLPNPRVETHVTGDDLCVACRYDTIMKRIKEQETAGMYRRCYVIALSVLDGWYEVDVLQ
jgi:hypothetical protein